MMQAMAIALIRIFSFVRHREMGVNGYAPCISVNFKNNIMVAAWHSRIGCAWDFACAVCTCYIQGGCCL